MASPAKNLLYAQSGGVTAVINTSAAGVIATARRNKAKIGRVYAAKNGILGVLREELFDTTDETDAAIKARAEKASKQVYPTQLLHIFKKQLEDYDLGKLSSISKERQDEDI